MRASLGPSVSGASLRPRRAWMYVCNRFKTKDLLSMFSISSRINFTVPETRPVLECSRTFVTSEDLT